MGSRNHVFALSPLAVIAHATKNDNVSSHYFRSAPVSNRNSLHRRSQSVGLFLDRLATAPSARAASNVSGCPVTPDNTRKKSDRRHRQRNKRTEVWSWGAGDKGQAGQGDILDRLQPSMISALSADGSAVQGWKILSSLAQFLSLHLDPGLIYELKVALQCYDIVQRSCTRTSESFVRVGSLAGAHPDGICVRLGGQLVGAIGQLAAQRAKDMLITHRGPASHGRDGSGHCRL